jgi:hypothetical protein
MSSELTASVVYLDEGDEEVESVHPTQLLNVLDPRTWQV